MHEASLKAAAPKSLPPHLLLSAAASCGVTVLVRTDAMLHNRREADETLMQQMQQMQQMETSAGALGGVSRCSTALQVVGRQQGLAAGDSVDPGGGKCCARMLPFHRAACVPPALPGAIPAPQPHVRPLRLHQPIQQLGKLRVLRDRGPKEPQPVGDRQAALQQGRAWGRGCRL